MLNLMNLNRNKNNEIFNVKSVKCKNNAQDIEVICHITNSHEIFLLCAFFVFSIVNNKVSIFSCCVNCT